MKFRTRLTDKEARAIGKKPKPKYKDGSNNRYMINEEQLNTVRLLRSQKTGHTAKICTIDIESAPTQAFVWQKWGQNIQDNQVEVDWFMLTWACKDLNGKSYGAKLTPKEALKEDDSRIVKSLWQVLNDADIVIGHNFDRFDRKKINTRFLLHGLPLPSSYTIIDTVKVARKQFGFHSNKLDFIAQQLGVGSKLLHEGFEMWRKCMNGDKEALDNMLKYNLVDVEINEKVYKKLLPFITSHPNLNNFATSTGVVCANCGSPESDFEQIGYFHTNSHSYEEIRCKCCGSRMRYNARRDRVTSVTR